MFVTLNKKNAPNYPKITNKNIPSLKKLIKALIAFSNGGKQNKTNNV
jgi:hypothetical protein